MRTLLRHRLRPLLWALPLLPLLLAAPVRADDPPKDPPKEGESTLRLFHVGALVQGRSDQVGERLGMYGVDQVNDETQPLFGHEAEESGLPVGTLDDLVEEIRSGVDPESWEGISGALLQRLGTNALLVRQKPETLAAVGALLKRLEDNA